MRFSTWDPEDPKGKAKFVDNPAAWDKTQDFVRNAMIASGLKYVEVKGEAAFYGPKIDLQFRSVTGREETASTNQLDFAVPARMGLTYVGSDGERHHPYVIHRAPLGTHERFVAFLIEHYAGAFPTWLAPVQVKVLTVSDKFTEYGLGLVDRLRSHYIRAEFDTTQETMGKKIRNAVTRKIPNILVVGEREQEEKSVTLRCYGSQKQVSMPYTEFEEKVLKSIRARSRESLIPATAEE